jgi:hypothetical protein
MMESLGGWLLVQDLMVRRGRGDANLTDHQQHVMDVITDQEVQHHLIARTASLLGLDPEDF